MQTRYDFLSTRHNRLSACYREINSSFINARLDAIGEHLSAHGEIEAESGRYGAHCPFTQASLGKCLDAVEELIFEIEDQLADWNNA
jgi:hypothetical protein